MKSIHCAITMLLLITTVEASEQIIETYGENDLAEAPAFQGNYINFGYWKGLNGELTREKRIQASKALYDLVVDHLHIQPDDHVVEVGSGQGNGVVDIAKTLKPALMMGIDITPQQIARSQKYHRTFLQDNPTATFAVGSSSALPLDKESCTKIFSVEAAQCFPSIEAFAQEAWRVLQPGGRLAVTAHFATDEYGYQALKENIPTVAQGVDRLIPIKSVRDAFSQNNFKEVFYQNIGAFVFEGFEQWRASVEDAAWGGNIVNSYRDGHMGYYLIVLEK